MGVRVERDKSCEASGSHRNADAGGVGEGRAWSCALRCTCFMASCVLKDVGQDLQCLGGWRPGESHVP